MSSRARLFERLLVPTVLFTLFLAGVLLAPELMRDIAWEISQRLAQTLIYCVQIGLWLSGAFLLVRLLNVFLWDELVAAGSDRQVPRLIRDSCGLIVFIVAFAGILGVVFDQSLTGIWAASGAIGIVIGLALRNIILDIFTGLAINFDRSYRIGDWVEIVDRGIPALRGQVKEINWRTTRIQTGDRRMLVIPNSRMGSIIVANLSMPDTICRFDVRIVLDFSVPRERAVRVLLAGVRAVCGEGGPLPEPAPNVLVSAVTDRGIEYRVMYSHAVDQPFEAVGRDRVAQSILRHLATAGLTPAYPKRDTFGADMPRRQREHHSVGDRQMLLGELELLAGLEPDQLEQLAEQIRLRRFAAGDSLMEQGAQGESMFVLAEGLCEVWQLNDEELRNVGRIQPGEFIGEMSLLTGEPRSATVTAATEVVAYELTSEQLAPILAETPILYEEISRVVAERRHRTTQRLAVPGADRHNEEIGSVAAQILERMRNFFRRQGQVRGEVGRRRQPTSPRVRAG